MINHRELEIRQLSTELVVRMHEFNLGMSTAEDHLLVDRAFAVCAQVAGAFTEVEDKKFTRDLTKGLGMLQEIRLSIPQKLNGQAQELLELTATLEGELEECLLKLREINHEQYSPKLEKVCI